MYLLDNVVPWKGGPLWLRRGMQRQVSNDGWNRIGWADVSKVSISAAAALCVWFMNGIWRIETIG